MSFFHSTLTSNTLFYVEGESNSRGFALLDPILNSADIGLQKSVKILDVNNFNILHDLIIGGDNYNNNNLLGTVESGQRGKERFGFELEIARRAKTNNWYSNPCHVVKCGQGGSIISQWNTGGAYDLLSQTAITNIKNFLKNIPHKIIILYSLGINDRLAVTDLTAWKNGVKARFEVLRSRFYANTPIIMTGFQSISGVDMTSYTSTLNQIAGEMSNVFCVDSTGCTTYDGIHWDAAETGMKQLTGRMLNIAEKVKF